MGSEMMSKSLSAKIAMLYRIYEELVHVRNEAESRKSGPQIRVAVDEVHHLLQL